MQVLNYQTSLRVGEINEVDSCNDDFEAQLKNELPTSLMTVGMFSRQKTAFADLDLMAMSCPFDPGDRVLSSFF